jgi:hypothetical protein
MNADWVGTAEVWDGGGGGAMGKNDIVIRLQPVFV